MPTITQTRDMPLSGLSMAVRNVTRVAPPEGEQAAGADAPAMTFEMVFSTGAGVRRYDWRNDRYYMEELVVTPEAIDLSRMERGVSLLDSHWAYSLAGVVGIVDQPQIENGQGLCRGQISRRADVQGIRQDLEDKVIRHVSVGYAYGAVEMVAPSEDGGMWHYRVTRWTPMEVSLVPIPADMDAGVRNVDGQLQGPDGRQLRTFPCVMTEVVRNTEQGSVARAAGLDDPAAGTAETTTTINSGATMPQAEQRGAGPGNPAGAVTTTTTTDQGALDAARAAGATAERARQAEIRTAVDAARGTLGDADATALYTRLVDGNVEIGEARREVLEQLTQRSNATASRGQASNIRTVTDEVTVTRQRMSDAITLRAQPGITTLGGTPIDVAGARNFRGMDLIDMARAAIRAAGGNPDGLSRREIALASLNLDSDAVRTAGMHSTSDFPNVLANTVNRSLRAAYQQAPRTFTPWTRRSTSKDFREKAVTQLSELSAFKKVNEGGEYKMLTFGDSAEKYSLSKYGGIIAITWEALVNDDMSAFDRLPMMIAEEAAATESDIVYGILSTNAALADTGLLFNSTAVTTAGGHANLAGSGAAISIASLGAGRAAMRKQTGPKGRVLNLAPDFLIVGPDKEQEANQYTSVNYVASTSGAINPNFNTALEVVVDNRIAGNLWYLAATPSRVDTIEYSYLEGEEGLFTERKEGFEVDGLMIKARHVFAAKAIDFRGLYRNPGA